MRCTTTPERRRRDEQLTLIICLVAVLFQATVLAFEPDFAAFVCALVLYALAIGLAAWALVRHRR